MKISAVIGNPPYNNDMYIPFVEMGHQLATDCSLFITPAKWQAKGGEKNVAFRQNIVPYMSEIVYYPYCIDVFDIWEASGIMYYIIDKNTHDKIEIENRCSVQKYFNSTEKRTINNNESLFNIGMDIVNKLGNYKKYSFYEHTYGEHQIWINGHCSGGGLFAMNNGNMLVLEPPVYININNESDEFKKTTVSRLAFASENIENCKSFVSWAYSKFIRFFIMICVGKLGPIIDDITWRFVPDPGAFDHIFTDKELYKKYNLTPEEIKIIESVIKERK